MNQKDLINQLTKARLINYISNIEYSAKGIKGNVNAILFLSIIRKDLRFQEGLLHGLHKDIGPQRRDFRSFNGTFGKGSLQVVISKKNNRLHADIDSHSPYNDVVSFVIHSGVVIWNWIRRK